MKTNGNGKCFRSLSANKGKNNNRKKIAPNIVENLQKDQIFYIINKLIIKMNLW